MTSLGANSDSLITKLDTDLGPLVSLLLNSLVLISLDFALIVIRGKILASHTEESHRQAGDNRIALKEYEGTQP